MFGLFVHNEPGHGDLWSCLGLLIGTHGCCVMDPASASLNVEGMWMDGPPVSSAADQLKGGNQLKQLTATSVASKNCIMLITIVTEVCEIV